MRKIIVGLLLLGGAAMAEGILQPVPVHWKNMNVAVLGDSITDKHQGHAIYWQYLGKWLDWKIGAFGVNGHQWNGVSWQSEKMFKEMGDDVDAIFIFIGTNDYASGVPLGKWYDEEEGKINWWGKERTLKKRTLNKDAATVRGRINIALEKIKKRYPTAQVILMTPIRRGNFVAGPTNVQPPENWSNTLGLHIEDYVDCVKEAAQIWSCPLIDLFSESGLLPCHDEFVPYFRNAKVDRLHPNGKGHERLAKTIYYKLHSMPSTFRR